MTGMPRISVIVPSFNQGSFIEKTLRSILDQEYPNLELIVIDGGSSDNTTQVLKEYGRQIAHWVSEKDRGQSHAFNKGLALATGEIIGWLNSDDVYLNRCLFHAAEYFAAQADIDVVFSDYIYIDEAGRYLKRRKEPPFDYSIYLWTGACYHANIAGFFRRRVFDRVGNLDETLHYSMDYEFYLRAGNAGVRFGHVRAYWGAYRFHSASKSMSAHDRMIAEARIITSWYRAESVGKLGAVLRRLLFQALRLGRKALMGSYFPFRPDFPISSSEPLGRVTGELG